MIIIPSKFDRERSLIVDAFRILAWQQFKQDNEVSGLKAYELFSEEWKDHEIQGYDLPKLKELVKQLGYSVHDLKTIRQNYYDKKSQIKAQEEQFYSDEEAHELDEIPF